MILIKQEKIIKEVSGRYDWAFDLADDGLYLIEIIAGAKSWLQNLKSFKSFLNADNLALTLDEIEISTSKSNENNARAAWNGNELKGCMKTAVIAIRLKKGKHALNFNVKQKPFLKNISISLVEEPDKIIYIPTDNNPAEKASGRPWLSFVVINLSVWQISILAKAQKRGWDDDDIKLIIDGEVQKNDPPVGGKSSHKDWYWCGKADNGTAKEFKKPLNFNHGFHYSDLYADETPFLEKIEVLLKLDNRPGVPTVDSPEWTGNFNDDSDQMILARAIFGEARSLPEQGRAAVGWVVKNRIGGQAWGNNYHEVILHPKHFSAFNPSDPNLPYVKNPLLDQTQSKDWYECYKIAGQIISGEMKDQTGGANHYFSTFIKPPHWTKDKNARLKLKVGNTLFYEIKTKSKTSMNFLTLFLLLSVVTASLIAFSENKTTKNISYRHYFINPKNEEVNVLDIGESGEIAGLRQLTFDQFPKSNLEVFEKNNMVGYFQNVRKRNESSLVSPEEYYDNYIKLMIKKGDNAKPFEVYRGDVHTSSWEWRDNEHVIVYRSCGTECMYYYLVDIDTKKTENEGLAYNEL